MLHTSSSHLAAPDIIRHEAPLGGLALRAPVAVWLLLEGGAAEG